VDIPVQLGQRSYHIVVEVGVLDRVGSLLRGLGVGTRTALVSDPSVYRLYGERVTTSLSRAGFSVALVPVPDGEAAKTLAVAEASWDALLTAGLDRSSTVLALGGGAVGDLAGFVAATYMRGINFVQIPTTVLAQVDASIGGKTAIDHPKAKNVVGAFHQPRLVASDPDAVRTLPERDFRSGLAEMVKHGVILDERYFAELEREAGALSARTLPALERAIAGSCRLKAAVVEQDEREAELRAALNYGHTIGHALEAATSFGQWTHGEAVALGMTAEARLAQRLGVAKGDAVARQERLLVALGLPVRAPALDVEGVLLAIGHDKKARDGRVPFVLSPSIGRFQIVRDIGPDDVRAALKTLIATGSHG
jgi:3-dehydroquinate synthase